MSMRACRSHIFSICAGLVPLYKIQLKCLIYLSIKTFIKHSLDIIGKKIDNFTALTSVTRGHKTWIKRGF